MFADLKFTSIHQNCIITKEKLHYYKVCNGLRPSFHLEIRGIFYLM